MALDQFIARWMHPDCPPRPVFESGLRAVETHFGFAFPSGYREEVLRHGLVSPTIALLDAIVDAEHPVADLSQLLDPQEMIASTEAWRDMGLPATMVAFGADCGGNLFCFDAANIGPIYHFDHDFGTVEQVAPSFTAWIEILCAIGEPRR